MLPESWENLGTEEKMDLLRREIESLRQVVAALARRVDQVCGTMSRAGGNPDSPADASSGLK
jgi:hypothetical protein